jgi:hypothetical protein
VPHVCPLVTVTFSDVGADPPVSGAAWLDSPAEIWTKTHYYTQKVESSFLWTFNPQVYTPSRPEAWRAPNIREVVYESFVGPSLARYTASGHVPLRPDMAMWCAPRLPDSSVCG